MNIEGKILFARTLKHNYDDCGIALKLFYRKPEDINALFNISIIGSTLQLVNRVIRSAFQEYEESDTVIPEPILVKIDRRPSRIIHGKEAYLLSKPTRGLCVIFANDKFKWHIDLLMGIKQDVYRFSKVFRQLHFEVKVHENKTSNEMHTGKY